MLECTESLDFLVSESLKRCHNLAILWYDYPKYNYDSVYINNNPHSGSNPEFRPYIRRKIGSDIWEFIKQKNEMSLVYRIEFGENNILEIFNKK
jgi:hypothetical protein